MWLKYLVISAQIPSLPAVFESYGMDLSWQGWVASLHGLISFFVAPVRKATASALGVGGDEYSLL